MHLLAQGYSRKNTWGGGGGGGEGKRYIFPWVVGADIFQIIWVIGVCKNLSTWVVGFYRKVG